VLLFPQIMMTNPQRINERIRFQTMVDTPFGQTMAYLRFKDYDLKREAEKLLISRFLPFALMPREPSKTGIDLSISTHIAYDCISHLSGIIQTIREVYQLQPAHPSTFPSPDSLSIAYQLSEAIQLMRQSSSVQSSPQFSPALITPNGQALSTQTIPESGEKDEEHLEVVPEQQQTKEQFNFLFGG
jgi:hypothetical protein